MLMDFMGSWEQGSWITCDVCGWGKYDGTDHYDIDGYELTVLCKWCDNVPSPPYWSGRANARHFMANMKLLPEKLKPITEITDLISDYLATHYPHVSA